MPTRWTPPLSRPRRAAPVLAALLLAAAGCETTRGALAEVDGQTVVRDPERLAKAGLAFRRARTANYAVLAVGPKPFADRELPAVVAEVGRWMEMALAQYERLLGEPAGRDGGPLPVTAHLVRKAYDHEASRLGFPPALTSGFCTVDGVVHVYYKPSGAMDPAATLMHEGFHQYCHRVYAAPTPLNVYQAYQGYDRPKLQTTPLWLAEGMAMVFESMALGVDPHRPDAAFVRLDGYNKPRLDQLHRVLRKGGGPTLAKVMSMQLGDPLTGDAYAVMWGVCYDLLRGGRMDSRVPAQLLRDGGALWGLDAAALFADCLRGAPSGKAFERAWNRRITQAALARFQRILAANGDTLESWERGWRERMFQVR